MIRTFSQVVKRHSFRKVLILEMTKRTQVRKENDGKAEPNPPTKKLKLSSPGSLDHFTLPKGTCIISAQSLICVYPLNSIKFSC